MPDRSTTIHDSHRPARSAKPGDPADPASTPRPVGVIDVGSSSIRMAIAEIDGEGTIRLLESLARDTQLGHDTFTRGGIRRATTESCVEVLRSYRQTLAEYGITRPGEVRVVATSAVREAENRLAFLDRIYVATGFEIDPIDEAEVNRMTYLGVQPLLEEHPGLSAAGSIVAEVGGGSTEVLLVEAGDVVSAHTYRLGSQRLRETLEAYRAPRPRVIEIMRDEVRRTMQQVRRQVPGDLPVEVVALGGDIRFAARQLEPGWDQAGLVSLSVDRLAELSDTVLELSLDELVRDYGFSYPEAGTVGGALLAYVELARGLDLDHLYVCNVNLRDGLLREMATTDAWSDDYGRQVTRSALALGRKYEFDEAHAVHVAELSGRLFDQLADEHQLEPRHGMLLHTAALLHEIGGFIDTGSLHKHTLYIVRHSDLFGLSHADVMLVALVARYHRGASPKPTHRGYNTLDREQRIAVAKLAALLRVAKALDGSRSQRVNEFTCRRADGQLVITLEGLEDLAVEQLALNQAGPLFEQIFGRQVLLRTGDGVD